MKKSDSIYVLGMPAGFAVARLFKGGVFPRKRQNPLASEEASYNTHGASFDG